MASIDALAKRVSVERGQDGGMGTEGLEDIIQQELARQPKHTADAVTEKVYARVTTAYNQALEEVGKALMKRGTMLSTGAGATQGRRTPAPHRESLPQQLG